MGLLSSSSGYPNNTDLLTLPTYSEGNRLVAVLSTGASGQTMSLSEGWTQEGTWSGTGTTSYVFSKIAGASETAPTLTTTRRSRATVMAFDAGALSVDAIVETGNSTTINFPTLTITNSATVIRYGCYPSANTVSTPPTGTLVQDQFAFIPAQISYQTTATAPTVAADTLLAGSSGRNQGITIAVEDAATSETATTGNIPLTIQAGYTKVDLVDPVTTNASLLFGVTGDTPITTNDLEYDVTSTLDASVSLDVAANAVWTVTETVDGAWVTDITVSRRVVQADGTIGTEAVLTLQAPTLVGGVPVEDRTNFQTISAYLIGQGTYSSTSTNEVIVEWLADEGYTDQFNKAFYDYLEAQGFTGTLTDKLWKWRNE